MKCKKLPELEALNKSFKYNKDTGKLYRRFSYHKPDEDGRDAGSLGNRGYLVVNIKCSGYLVHRIVYKLHHGVDPDHIDHINGDKLDNRIENLRSVSQTENGKNVKLNKNNKIGYLGVHMVKNNNKWWAQIKVDGKGIYLGSFDNKQDAINARKEAEKKYGFHENHGRVT